MTTFNQLVDETRMALAGMGLVQPRAAFLTTSVTADDLTLPVSDASSFGQGIAEIGDEVVFIQETVGGGSLGISPDGRGYYGTTASDYPAGTRIEFAPAFPKVRVSQALNDAIVGVYPDLYGVGTTTFTYSPVVTTYALPTEAERVLQVTIDTIGPSNEKAKINRYSLNQQAHTITLEEGGMPGRTVTVVYAKRPGEISGIAAFTDSGLSETARMAVRYAACSHLVAYLDVSRIVVDTGVAGEYDSSHNAVGNASRISAQLYQRYELELTKEQARLRANYAPPVSMRTR